MDTGPCSDDKSKKCNSLLAMTYLSSYYLSIKSKKFGKAIYLTRKTSV